MTHRGVHQYEESYRASAGALLSAPAAGELLRLLPLNRVRPADAAVTHAGYESISVLSKHGGLAPLRIGLWKDTTPGKANLGYRCAALLLSSSALHSDMWTHSSMLHCRLARTSNTNAVRLRNIYWHDRYFNVAGFIQVHVGLSCSSSCCWHHTRLQDSGCVLPSSIACNKWQPCCCTWLQQFTSCMPEERLACPYLHLSKCHRFGFDLAPAAPAICTGMGCCTMLAATTVQGYASHVPHCALGAGAAASTIGGHDHADAFGAPISGLGSIPSPHSGC